jgi:thymidylate synthase (FAD)
MFAHLIDHMGSDAAVVEAARVSYAKGTKTVSDDRALIRYLMRHKHTTPFEMVEFKFHVKCPIFVARQWMRHRTASVNEVSGRYSIMEDEYFLPENLRTQSATNHQGSEDVMEGDELLLLKQKASCDLAFHVYSDLLQHGCSRELARTHLPLSTFTEFYWKIDLHNLLHFLKLRMDSHAQPEIQDLAKQMYELIRPVVPFCCEAFEDFVVGAVTFSRLEIEALRGNPLTRAPSTIPGKGESKEFQQKLKIFE